MVRPMILMNEKALCRQRLRKAVLRRFLNIKVVLREVAMLVYSLLKLLTGLASAARTAL